MKSELERIELLRRHFARDDSCALVGIGDDAAVLAAIESKLVWTVDVQVEGTHFRRDLASWEDVGFRSLMAAASDLAAMAAAPVAALSALILAPTVSDDDLEAIARGQADASRELDAPIVGGNLARGETTSITTTLLGRCEAPVLRSGAKKGDRVWASGPLGLAAAGLVALERRLSGGPLEPCISAWRRPRARISCGLAMRGIASSAIDVSDGLARDLHHVAKSSGVRVVLDEGALLAHAGDALRDAAGALEKAPLGLVLGGGEDYAVVATSPRPLPGFSEIGFVEEGPHGSVVLKTSAGTTVAIDTAGFDHFV